MQVKTQADQRLKDALNIAINMRMEGRPQDALRYMESVRPFFDDPEALRRFHNGLGVTYFELCDYERAVKEYELALHIAGDELETAAIQGNIANALLALGRTDEAHAFLSHAEAVLRERGEDAWLCDRRETRARAYLAEGKFKEAVAAADEAYELARYGISEVAIEYTLDTLTQCRKALRENHAHP